MQTIERVTKAGRTLTFTPIGTGCAPLGNLYAPVPEADAMATLSAAYRAGVRTFDVAPSYGLGLSERRLGTFLRSEMPADVTLSTKAGRLLRRAERGPNSQLGQWFKVGARDIDFDYSYDGIMRSFEFSLERLGVDKVDILYCHDIDETAHGSVRESERQAGIFIDSGQRAMVELRDAGLIDAFGLGINTNRICTFIGERAELDVILLAGRYTLLEQEALDAVFPMCSEKQIAVVIGGPYNSGILATGAVEGARYDYREAPTQIIETVKGIEAVAARHNVRLRDAAIRFPLAHEVVACLIPGAISAREVEETVAALSVPIAAEFWAELKSAGLLREDAPTPS